MASSNLQLGGRCSLQKSFLASQERPTESERREPEYSSGRGEEELVFCSQTSTINICFNYFRNGI